MAMTPQLAFSRMPPGFRFQPTDEQLVVDYLQRRTAAQPCVTPDITDIDVYNVDPWQLPGAIYMRTLICMSLTTYGALYW